MTRPGFTPPKPDAPLRVELTLGEGDRTELETLWRKMTDPTLTPLKQSMWREAYRVAEVLYEKQNGPRLAARRAIPVVCEKQQRFLFTRRREHRVDVSLSDLAAATGGSLAAIPRGIRGRAVQAPAGTIAIDRLVGPVGHGWPKGRLGYIETWCLVPTDRPRDTRKFEEALEIFREGREEILDPVLVVEDSKRPGRAFVLQGHHRVAAAVVVERKVRVALLHTIDEVRRHLREGVADLTEKRSIDELIEECEGRSGRLGPYEGRWDGWLGTLP